MQLSQNVHTSPIYIVMLNNHVCTANTECVHANIMEAIIKIIKGQEAHSIT